MKLILIVDDDAEVREVTTKMFELHGFRVLAAAQGNQALDYVRAFAPDLIVSDYEMPDLNGAEFAAQVRADARAKSTPIILVSGANPAEHALPLFDAIMPKPVKLIGLVAEAKRLIA